jgi:glucose/arabinose dehydrogenase
MRGVIAALTLGLCTAAIAGASQAHPPAEGYARDGRTCDGFPRAAIEMVKGLCAGIVFAPPPEGQKPSRRTLRLPRTLMALPGGDMLVTDLGSWEPGHGSVWRLSAQQGRAAKLAPLLRRLDLPHTVLTGPDGRVYVGEMSRIIRFDPDAPHPQATVEVVVADLPANRLHDNRHPLSSFLFDGNGDLLVNVGAPTDQCAPKAGETRCAEAEGDLPAAAVWRYPYQGDGHWSARPVVFARGLRNSLALARHPSGTILQAENSIDIPKADRPYDEINRLEAGHDYGWPYCVGAGDLAPAWARGGFDCKGKAFDRPALLLPPHGAPLSLVYYDGAMFPQLEGRLLVSLHGYRATGSRIIAYEVDAAGVPLARAGAIYWTFEGGWPRRRAYVGGPAAEGLVLTPGWKAAPGRRPSGAPVGLAVAADGAIWVAEDRNGAILRFAKDRP